MFVKYYPNRLIFFVNILAIVPLGCIVRFSHILPEYLAHIAGDIAYEILLVSIDRGIYLSISQSAAHSPLGILDNLWDRVAQALPSTLVSIHPHYLSRTFGIRFDFRLVEFWYLFIRYLFGMALGALARCPFIKGYANEEEVISRSSIVDS